MACRSPCLQMAYTLNSQARGREMQQGQRCSLVLQRVSYSCPLIKNKGKKGFL